MMFTMSLFNKIFNSYFDQRHTLSQVIITDTVHATHIPSNKKHDELELYPPYYPLLHPSKTSETYHLYFKPIIFYS